MREFVQFAREHKKVWLIPLIMLVALAGLVAITAQTQALAPFIYSLF
jgi:hypothetical protein